MLGEYTTLLIVNLIFFMFSCFTFHKKTDATVTLPYYISILVVRTPHVPEDGVATNLTTLELISIENTIGFVSPTSVVENSVKVNTLPAASHAAITSLVL